MAIKSILCSHITRRSFLSYLALAAVAPLFGLTTLAQRARAVIAARIAGESYPGPTKPLPGCLTMAEWGG